MAHSTRRTSLLAVGAGLLAGLALGFVLLRSGGEGAQGGTPERPTVEIVSTLPRDPAEAQLEIPREGPMPDPGALPPEAEQYPESFRDLESGEEEIEIIPPTMELPVLEKLVPEPLSEVPHEVMGAWDEAGESPDPGRRRAFVVVVDAGSSDAAIEALARDIRARHRDAGILDVRIYDDARATRQSRALDGGRLAFEHLVGEVKRNEALELDVIRVRGRKVEP